MGWISSPLSARSQRRLSHLLQAGIVGILLVGLWSRTVAVVVNAALGLLVTLLPTLLTRDRAATLAPGLTLWIAGTVFLHAVGMVGLYDRIWWWDHLTHVLSGVLVAGVGYVTARVLDEYSDAVTLPPELLFVFVVIFTLAAGVLWELIEYVARELAVIVGAEPVLVLYGLEDTLLDLVFDAIGAALLGLFGAPRLEATVDRFRVRLRRGR